MQKRYLMLAFTLSSRLCTEDLQTNGLFFLGKLGRFLREEFSVAFSFIKLPAFQRQLSRSRCFQRRRRSGCNLTFWPVATSWGSWLWERWISTSFDSSLILRWSRCLALTCYLGDASFDNFDDWFNVLNEEALKHSFSRATTRWATHIESIRKFVFLPLIRCISPYSGENQYQNKKSAFQMRYIISTCLSTDDGIARWCFSTWQIISILILIAHPQHQRISQPTPSIGSV